jgi:hypothetical protein
MVKIDLKNFDLQKLKVGGKSIHIEYYDLNRKNDLVTIDSDSKPSDDLKINLDLLKEVFADSLGLTEGWNHAIDHIKTNEEALKLAIHKKKLIISECEISGLKLVGGEDNECIVITGSFETDYGTIGTATKPIAIDEVETLSEIIAGISNEVFMFIFKGKRDSDLFNQKEEKKSGLNNTEDKHLKAV